jgi:hypothetical protein
VNRTGFGPAYEAGRNASDGFRIPVSPFFGIAARFACWTPERICTEAVSQALDEITTVKVVWSDESLNAARTGRSTLTPSMHTDFSKASAAKNLLIHKEGDQTHITNDAKTVRKLLKRESFSKELQERMVKIEERFEELGKSHEQLKKRVGPLEEQAQLRALIEMDLRCNNIRKSLLAFPNARFKSTNGGPKIDPVTREERNINTHALLLPPCLGVCSMGAPEPRHSNLFEAYFGISVKEAESWSMPEFEDIVTICHIRSPLMNLTGCEIRFVLLGQMAE